ncbi:DUF2726 domain-containing protein [Vibrio sp. Of14-4]|uniref:DUF2726 domain-containing protein n=1 Tax=Vibrio sp. Of14-4 TaxID=2724878 RepID=UPI001EF2BE7C|nr:DUF2726 domain-containing protein [Vibrio sp. Of14-4]MCG7490113.1 DUF2726 domain-containing protein [Vibrio sp. Of14-4]
MLLLILIVFVAAVILVISLFTRTKQIPIDNSQSSMPVTYQYDSRASIASPEELEFYRALSVVVKGRDVIFTKVSAADLMLPRKGLYSGGDRQRAYNKLSRKHVDFVLCDPITLEIRTLIQLDSDKKKTSNEIKNYVEKAAKTAGLTTKRFCIEKSYDYDEIEKVLYGEHAMLNKMFATR